MSTALNMEQVSLGSLSTGLFLRDGQTYFIENNDTLSVPSYLSGDIVQQALDGLNTNLMSPIQLDLNKPNNISDNYFVLDKNSKEREEEKVVQLSISDDFPIHLLNSGKTVESLQTPSDSSLIDSLLGPDNGKTDNSLSLDVINSLLQLPPNEINPEPLNVTSPEAKGNVTYAYQLVNGSKINQMIQNACLTVPINAVSDINKITPRSKPVEVAQLDSKTQNGKKLIVLKGGKSQLLLKLKNKATQNSVQNNIQRVKFVPSNGIPSKTQRNVSTQKSSSDVINKLQNPEFLCLNRDGKTLQIQNLSQDISTNTFQSLSNIHQIKPSSHVPFSGKVITSGVGVPDENLTGSNPEVHPDASSLFEKPPSPDSQSKPTERLTEEELKKLAIAFQNGELKLDKTNNCTTLYDSEKKTKIICRVLYPEELTKTNNTESVKTAVKRAKPANSKPANPESSQEHEEKKNKVKKNKVKKPKILPRTRSGRLSRPPRHMYKDFKKLKTSDISSSDSESDVVNENIENTPAFTEGDLELTRYKNRRCPTCGKVYFGRKMLLHLTKYPDHGDINTVFSLLEGAQKQPAYPHHHQRLLKEWRKAFVGKNPKGDSSLLKEMLNNCSQDIFVKAASEGVCKNVTPWDYLMERQPAGDGAVRGLLIDLTDILNSIPQNILQKADPADPNAIHISDERLCCLLNIPPGLYLPNDCALKPPKPVELPPDPWPTSMQSEPPLLQEKLGDKVDLKMDCSLDLDKKETGPDLSDLLDKSLTSVDEILNDRLNDLIPLDVSSLVESQSLDRSLFSTSSLGLHNVSSESTEDLLKTLENFNPELPSVSVPTDFDFAVLSTDFVNER